MIDFNNAQKAFENFLKNYDLNNKKIILKMVHTYKVVDLIENIVKDLNLSKTDIELARLIALLHDIGRFEQIKLYNNFDDCQNVDHAKLGLKILFEDGLIREFIKETEFDNIIYKAILNHNKLKIESDLSDKELLHCKIIRDADKADIFRVQIEDDLWVLYDHSLEYLQNEIISQHVYESFMNHELLVNGERKTHLDLVVSNIAFIFDLNYISSLKYIKENNYINKIIDRIDYKNPDTKMQMSKIRDCANKYLMDKLEEGIFNE